MKVEWHDLVDDNDKVVGKISRDKSEATDETNVRAVNLFIRNSKGELWVPRRTMKKKTFPGCWDFAMGGHVDSGETYVDALIRESQEELNMTIRLSDVVELGKMTPSQDGSSCFLMNYEIQCDYVPSYNPEDYSGAEWLLPQDIVDRIEAGERAKPDLLPLVKKYYI